MFDLVNGWVCDAKPGESENDILLAISHDVEEVFLGNPFNASVESASIVDSTGLVCSLIYVTNSNRGG